MKNLCGNQANQNVVMASTFDRNANKLLHQKFVKFGNERRKLTNELLVLLPEIYEKRIYKKYASSIEEYAAKFGGLTESVVRKRLRLEKHLEHKPRLREAIRSEGINKVAIMASLVNPENEEAMVDKIRNMSKPALQELAKELRAKRKGVGDGDRMTVGMFGQNGVSDEIDGGANGAACKAVAAKLTIELDEEMTFMFLKIKKEMGKMRKNMLSNREVMANLLQMMSENFKEMQKIERKREAKKEAENLKSDSPTSVKALPGESAASLAETFAGDNDQLDEEFENAKAGAKAKSRYIPAAERKNSLQKTNNHCAYPRCNRPPEVFHHTERFAESHSHKSIQPLCKIHHEFAHNGVIANEKGQAKNWRLRVGGSAEMKKVDELYRVYRQA
ncbi:MAG: hypothetical protein AAB373_03010 [Patescibacteria group bacterium]